MPKTTAVGAASVSGPGIDKDGYPTVAVALSAAITFAQRSQQNGDFYVRNADGVTVARVERDRKRTRIFRLTGGE